jgi:hypothetical protein
MFEKLKICSGGRKTSNHPGVSSGHHDEILIQSEHFRMLPLQSENSLLYINLEESPESCRRSDLTGSGFWLEILRPPQHNDRSGFRDHIPSIVPTRFYFPTKLVKLSPLSWQNFSNIKNGGQQLTFWSSQSFDHIELCSPSSDHPLMANHSPVSAP